MNAFDLLGDPVRRRIVEILATGDHSAGEVTRVIREEFGISQPAVSNHLRVLREGGVATARADGARRLYALRLGPLDETVAWVEQQRERWSRRLDALDLELRRGRARNDDSASAARGTEGDGDA